MWCLSFLLSLLLWFVPVATNSQANVEMASHLSHLIEQPSVFWINLDENIQRAQYTKKLLRSLHVPSPQQVRISAVTPTSPDYSLKVLEKPCKRNTDKDIAVIMSHLKAMYYAIHFDPMPNNKYALVIEDDVRFWRQLNFTSLVESAPTDFGILQLTSSNHEAIAMLWSKYQSRRSLKPEEVTDKTYWQDFWHLTHWQQYSKNGKTYMFWSAQAYLIQKAVIKAALDKVVAYNHTSQTFSFRIINSFFAQQCPFTLERPCVLSNCLFADSYLYSFGRPTYVSLLPLATGTKIGLNSTIHQAEVAFHKEGFAAMRQIQRHLDDALSKCNSHLRRNDTRCARLPLFLLQHLVNNGA